jgi:hypothetical protein
MIFVALFVELLVACDLGPSYEEVQKADTIEAYEAFLAADPESIYKFACNKRLEELYFARGQQEGTRAAWEAYLTRFPEGGSRDTAERELATAAFSEAAKANTAEAFRQFLADFPKTDKWLRARAEGRAAAMEYGKLELGTPKVDRVNMAEDPKGPLNGWGVAVEVANRGDKTLNYVALTMEFLGEDGHVLGSKDYPLTSTHWTMPATELQQTPMKPGETRTWLWTEGDDTAPKEWKQAVNLTVTGLKVAP